MAVGGRDLITTAFTIEVDDFLGVELGPRGGGGGGGLR